jgi:hypothetical protein
MVGVENNCGRSGLGLTPSDHRRSALAVAVYAHMIKKLGIPQEFFDPFY